MDAEKLFRILKDIQQDEQNLGISSKIDAIRSSVAQNNPDGFTSALTQLTDFLKQIRETSLVYSYSYTENLLLEKIHGTPYFGKGLILRLETIFTVRSFELIAKIDEYRNQRNDFIKKAQRLATGFTDMAIEEYRPDAYEVGLVLPEQESDLDKIARRIKDLRLLLSGLSEVVGVEQKNIKITRLSNGSFELFSLQSFEVATLLSTLLLNVSMIWDKIAQFRNRIADTDKDSLLSIEAKKEIKETLTKETNKIKEEILDDMPEKLLKDFGKKLEDGRKNEIRNQIRISVRTVFAWFEADIKVDITPIRVADQVNKSEKELKMITAIEETNERLQTMYQLPSEIKKLPFKLPEPEETLEDKHKEAKKDKSE